jgi:hypothetical protein
VPGHEGCPGGRNSPTGFSAACILIILIHDLR